MPNSKNRIVAQFIRWLLARLRIFFVACLQRISDLVKMKTFWIGFDKSFCLTLEYSFYLVFVRGPP
jgi:hypothetical protein